MTRFAVSLLRLATLALFGAASSIACAQATIDQNKALAGNISPGDAPGFPITLSVPGHYKLMGNLNVPENTTGILITADGVTLDLNGFTLRGPVSCTRDASSRVVSCSHAYASANGIEAASAVHDTLVRNGNVRGFQGSGVALWGHALVEDLKISHNKIHGLSMARSDATGVAARLNGDGGISTLGMVSRSRARENGGYGISAYYIQESLASDNKSYGINGRVRASAANDNLGGNYSGVSVSLGGNANGYAPF